MDIDNIPTKPTPNFKWADDEDDDWDLDTWKVKAAKVGAPTIEELGPLQLPPAEDDPLFSVSKATNNPSARAARQRQLSADARELPEDSYISQWGEIGDFSYLLRPYVEDRPTDPPAYPELSGHSGGDPSPYRRKKYTSNWVAMKVKSGKDCRLPILYKQSLLYKMQCAVDDIVIVVDAWEQSCNNEECAEEEEVHDLQLSSDLSPAITLVMDRSDIVTSHQDVEEVSNLMDDTSSERSSEVVKAVSQDAEDAHHTDSSSNPSLRDELVKLYPLVALYGPHGDIDFAEAFPSDDESDPSGSAPPSPEKDCTSGSAASSLELEEERKQDTIDFASEQIVVRLPPSTACTGIDVASSPAELSKEVPVDTSTCIEAIAMERQDSMDALKEGIVSAFLAMSPEQNKAPIESDKDSNVVASQEEQHDATLDAKEHGGNLIAQVQEDDVTVDETPEDDATLEKSEDDDTAVIHDDEADAPIETSENNNSIIAQDEQRDVTTDMNEEYKSVVTQDKQDDAPIDMNENTSTIAQNEQRISITHLPTLYSTFLSYLVDQYSCTVSADIAPQENAMRLPVEASCDATDTNIPASMTEYISSAMSSSWLTLTSDPWSTVGIAAAGVGLGGLVQFARRR